jgi:hypothetical protein
MKRTQARPEIEARAAFAELELLTSPDKSFSSTTYADLLEVYQQPKPHARWAKALDHDSLLEHTEVREAP